MSSSNKQQDVADDVELALQSLSLLTPEKMPRSSSSDDDETERTETSFDSLEMDDEDDTFKPAPTNAVAPSSNMSKAISACSLYSFCSVSMILVNKSLASSYADETQGNLNILLVVFQAIIAVISVEACRRLNWIDYNPVISKELVKQWLPVNLLFCLMLGSSMAALQTNTVPMVTVFKNVTNIFTTTGDWFFFGNKPECLVWAAFGVMLTGAVAASVNDLNMTATGLAWMGVNCVSTAAYVLYLKHATTSIQLSKFGMVYVNNVLCMCLLLPVASQVSTFMQSKGVHTVDYAFKNAFAGFVGFGLNFASLNCVATTGPTTYAIVGSVNKVPVALLGYALFDAAISSETWMYIGVSMCGGFLYSYAKIKSPKRT